MTRFLLLVCLFLIGATSQVVQSASPHLQGAEFQPTVSQPPSYMTYALFVGRFNERFRAQIAPQLSEGDLALLDKLAEHEPAATLDDNAVYASNAINICESAAAMSEVAVASALEKLALDFNQNRLDRYLNTFASMTESGRQTVLSFISDHISASSRYQKGSGAVEFAVRSPEDFRLNLKYWCYSIRYGDLHPDVKEKIQEQTADQHTESQFPGSTEPRIDPEP